MHLKSFKPVLKIIILLKGLLFFMSLQSIAQDCIPLPRMWVRDSFSNVRKEWFKTGKLSTSNKTKLEVLNSIIGKPHPVTYFFPVSSFDDLFNKIDADFPNFTGGVRVYFLAFNPDLVPTGCSTNNIEKNQIVFLFAPTANWRSKDLGKYYLISPTDYKVCSVDLNVKLSWETQYNQSEMNSATGLPTTIEPNQPENLPSNTTKYGDTKSIFYIYDTLKEFLVTERHYQDNSVYNNPTHIQISKIAISLAAFTDQGIGPNIYNYPEKSFKSRMLLYFDFVRTEGGSDVLFSIESTKDFECRLKNSIGLNLLFTPPNIGSGDNGHLCPPNCP